MLNNQVSLTIMNVHDSANLCYNLFAMDSEKWDTNVTKLGLFGAETKELTSA